MTQEEFSRVFKGSPMKRAKRRGLARNAAVALGNASLRSAQGDVDADVAALEAALDHDEPLVREHAAWALGRLDPIRRAAHAADSGVETEPT